MFQPRIWEKSNCHRLRAGRRSLDQYSPAI
jgi:hypothetical protein